MGFGNKLGKRIKLFMAATSFDYPRTADLQVSLVTFVGSVWLDGWMETVKYVYLAIVPFRWLGWDTLVVSSSPLAVVSGEGERDINVLITMLR